MKDNEKLLSVKELAELLGRSENYVRYMLRCGFRMKAGRTTLTDALLFLENHPNPCSEYRRKNG